MERNENEETETWFFKTFKVVPRSFFTEGKKQLRNDLKCLKNHPLELWQISSDLEKRSKLLMDEVCFGLRSCQLVVVYLS